MNKYVYTNEVTDKIDHIRLYHAHIAIIFIQNWNIVESGIKHHNSRKQLNKWFKRNYWKLLQYDKIPDDNQCPMTTETCIR